MLNPVVNINVDTATLCSTLQGRVVYTLRAIDAKVFKGFLDHLWQA